MSTAFNFSGFLVITGSAAKLSGNQEWVLALLSKNMNQHTRFWYLSYLSLIYANAEDPCSSVVECLTQD